MTHMRWLELGMNQACVRIPLLPYSLLVTLGFFINFQSLGFLTGGGKGSNCTYLTGLPLELKSSQL